MAKPRALLPRTVVRGAAQALTAQQGQRAMVVKPGSPLRRPVSPLPLGEVDASMVHVRGVPQGGSKSTSDCGCAASEAGLSQPNGATRRLSHAPTGRIRGVVPPTSAPRNLRGSVPFLSHSGRVELDCGGEFDPCYPNSGSAPGSGLPVMTIPLPPPTPSFEPPVGWNDGSGVPRREIVVELDYYYVVNFAWANRRNVTGDPAADLHLYVFQFSTGGDHGRDPDPRVRSSPFRFVADVDLSAGGLQGACQLDFPPTISGSTPHLADPFESDLFQPCTVEAGLAARGSPPAGLGVEIFDPTGEGGFGADLASAWAAVREHVTVFIRDPVRSPVFYGPPIPVRTGSVTTYVRGPILSERPESYWDGIYDLQGLGYGVYTRALRYTVRTFISVLMDRFSGYTAY